MTPIEVLVHGPRAGAVRARLAALPGMADAVLSGGADSNRAGTSVVVGIPAEETVNSSSLEAVRTARSSLDGQPGVMGSRV